MKSFRCAFCKDRFSVSNSKLKYQDPTDPTRLCSASCLINYLQSIANPDFDPAAYGALPVFDSDGYRSTYEEVVARVLSASGVKFVYEAWLLPTKPGDPSNTGSYTPDFFLPDLGWFVEVKGMWAPGSRRKMKKVRTLYPDLRLIVSPWYMYESWESHKVATISGTDDDFLNQGDGVVL